MKKSPSVCYFTMEVALHPALHTYSGGLGVLAGDTLRSAADLGLDVVAVSLLYRQGYFHQRLDAEGNQTAEPASWPVEEYVEPLAPRVTVELGGREVQVRAWTYRIRGVGGASVPVYLLDTDLPENASADRRLTDRLYGSDRRYRLSQEVILGLAGVRMLRALGHFELSRFHLNEGHAALVVLALDEERPAEPDDERLRWIRSRCAFTTHTPVPAGHDRFPEPLVLELLGRRRQERLEAFGQPRGLNMTQLALRGSGFVNAVSMRHAEVTREMFPGTEVHAITNGIHPGTWAAPSLATLFDRHVPDWRRDAGALRGADGIPGPELLAAHTEAKQALGEELRRRTGRTLDPGVLTLGFARRATAYKRAALIFRDPERLAALAADAPLQLVFAGKAHPQDAAGKELIRQIHQARDALRGRVDVHYLEDYDLDLGRLLCAGCDVWLNTPIPPKEASGTSGMKAALNGVPNLSVLDGWWVEGHDEGVTGWAIPGSREEHADGLYRKLGEVVAPLYYGDREGFLSVMRGAIAVNAPVFNTERMVRQYLDEAWSRP